MTLNTMAFDRLTHRYSKKCNTPKNSQLTILSNGVIKANILGVIHLSII
jgi:hypothetical protein